MLHAAALAGELAKAMRALAMRGLDNRHMHIWLFQPIKNCRSREAIAGMPKQWIVDCRNDVEGVVFGQRLRHFAMHMKPLKWVNAAGRRLLIRSPWGGHVCR